LLKGSPHRQRKKADKDMSLSPLLFAVEDRPHPQGVFFGTETVFHFRKLDVGIPEGFRVFEQIRMGLGQASLNEEMRPCVCSVASNFNISLSTISHHIKELRNAGLVHCERQGQTIL
jgi:DNA-binding transcriptional ArsR family regulator